MLRWQVAQCGWYLEVLVSGQEFVGGGKVLEDTLIIDLGLFGVSSEGVDSLPLHRHQHILTI